jgi:hypothetical protein
MKLMTVGETHPRAKTMKTLYDLLGARPDDDVERLKIAFRKAAKASHPDLHAGDPDASVRFRQIVAAYDVLRNEEQRATYDRLLAFQCAQLRSKSKHVTSYFMYHILAAVTGAGLASVLAGGYTLFTHVSKAPVETVEVVGVTASGLGNVAPVQLSARTNTADPGELGDKLERATVPDMPMMMPRAVALAANDGGAPEVREGGPSPSPAALITEVAKPDDIVDLSIDTASAKTAADPLGKNERIEPRDQDKAQSADVQFSSAGKDNWVPKSPLSDFAMSYDKHHMKMHGAPKLNMSDMKASEIKSAVRPSTTVKRPAGNRPPLTQAFLENRGPSDCSGLQSCSGDLPPLFGVGF